MQVTYPSHHTWLMDISSGIDTNFSGRVAKKIQSTLPLLTSNNITYSIEPLTEDFFTEFTPLYEKQIGGKQNALLHDIKDKTLHNKKNTFLYYAITLREQGIFMGGAIFSVRNDRVSYAYRTYINEWQIATKLKAGPALIGEYAVAAFACEHGLNFVVHGKDRNPYGLNASIGLATFKMSVGCVPSVANACEIKIIETDTITEDCLILVQPETGSIITKAYLIVDPKNEATYLRATKYPELLTVEVMYRT